MKEHTKSPERQSRTVESNSNGFIQPPVSEILQAYRNGTLGRRSPIQRESIEEEDDLTSGQPPVSAILQQYGEKRQKYASEEDEEIVQGKFDTAQRQEKSNNTGLPDNLKSGIENLSGYSMDDVKVHYNSDKPAQLNALAYTQGTNIHVAPGQEKHLPHEAWHVVQQKQGRVQPTVQMQGVNVNDNEGLENEADVMGHQALINIKEGVPIVLNSNFNYHSTSIQLRSFFIGETRYNTESMSIDEMKFLINTLKHKGDTTGLQSMREALAFELKARQKKTDEASCKGAQDYAELIKIIDAPLVVVPEKVVSASEIRERVLVHPFRALAGIIGILDNRKITFWLNQKGLLPKGNTKAEIAEALTFFALRRNETPKKEVLTGVRIAVDNGETAEHRYTDMAEIDHLVLIKTERGLVPEKIVETKAGAEGKKPGELKKQLVRKLKALQTVKTAGYRILHNDIDITEQFNLDALETANPQLLSSGVNENNDMKLDIREIEGIYGFLELVKEHMIAQQTEQSESETSSSHFSEALEPTGERDTGADMLEIPGGRSRRPEFTIDDWDGKSLPDEVFRCFIKTRTTSFLVNGMVLNIKSYSQDGSSINYSIRPRGG